MRINGFEQIKAFYSWVFNNPDKVRPTHISLYLFLWNQGNRANWVEWFKCPYDLAMQGACIGNKGTYYRCLDELQSYGLIIYKKGINNHKAPLINLIRLYKSEPLPEQVTVPQSEPQSEPQGVPLPEPQSGNIYKLLTTKTIKLITKESELINLKLEGWINNENVSIDNNIINKIKTEILNSKSWIEQICMKKRIELNVCLNYLNTFLDDADLKDELNNVSDTKRHFVNWLNIQLRQLPKEELKTGVNLGLKL